MERWPGLARGGVTTKHALVDRLIPIRHYRRCEIAFDMTAAGRAIERCDLRHRLDQFLERGADEASHAIQDDLRYRTVPAGDHRGPGRHRLHHGQTERLRPVDGEEIGVGIPEHLVLFLLVDLPNVFDESPVSANQWGDRGLVIGLIDHIDLSRDHELHPDVTGNLDGPVGSLLGLIRPRKTR